MATSYGLPEFGGEELELEDIVDAWGDLRQDEISREPKAYNLSPSSSQSHSLSGDDGGVALSRTQSGDDGAAMVKQCWGGVMQGNTAGCTSGFVCGSGHFKTKLCPNCLKAGIWIPMSRVRTLPATSSLICNSRAELGVWNILRTGNAAVDAEHAQYRTVNHTSRCVGPRLAVFCRDGSPDLGGEPMPDCWAIDGKVHLLHSKGTLVPAAVLRDASHLAALRERDHDRQAANRTTTTEKRARVQDNEPSLSTPAYANTLPSQAVEAPCHPNDDLSSVPSASELLASHERLLRNVSACLLHGAGSDMRHTSLSALLGPLYASTAILRHEASLSPPPALPELAPPPPCLSPARISNEPTWDEARPSTAASVAASVAGSVAGSVTGSVLSMFAPSFPPSPPGSSFGGSRPSSSEATRPRGAPVLPRTTTLTTSRGPFSRAVHPVALGDLQLADEAAKEPGRWSSGLFSCILHPIGSAFAILCCPTILAQLWVRSIAAKTQRRQRRSSCLCIAVGLWLFVALAAASALAMTTTAAHVDLPMIKSLQSGLGGGKGGGKGPPPPFQAAGKGGGKGQGGGGGPHGGPSLGSTSDLHAAPGGPNRLRSPPGHNSGPSPRSWHDRGQGPDEREVEEAPPADPPTAEETEWCESSEWCMRLLARADAAPGRCRPTGAAAHNETTPHGGSQPNGGIPRHPSGWARRGNETNTTRADNRVGGWGRGGNGGVSNATRGDQRGDRPYLYPWWRGGDNVTAPLRSSSWQDRQEMGDYLYQLYLVNFYHRVFFFALAAFAFASTMLLCTVRQHVRNREGIRGAGRCDIVTDFGATACCFPCVLCQVSRHEGLIRGRTYEPLGL